MKLAPNLSSTWRIVFVAFGGAVIAAPFALGTSGWERWLLPILGLMAIFTGVTGWC